MQVKRKSKLLLKPEYLKDLYNTYPNAFEYKETTVKVKQDYNFIKLMKKTIEGQKYILNNLGVTYIGYMNLLLNSLDYNNKVDFRELQRLGVKEGMIKVAKKKFLEHNIVKKYEGNFYLNPSVAIKGESINPDIINLFSN